MDQFDKYVAESNYARSQKQNSLRQSEPNLSYAKYHTENSIYGDFDHDPKKRAPAPLEHIPPKADLFESQVIQKNGPSERRNMAVQQSMPNMKLGPLDGFESKQEKMQKLKGNIDQFYGDGAKPNMPYCF